MIDVEREDVLEGSIVKVLVGLSIPLVGQTLFSILQAVVDVFWLGRLGGDAVAAVGLALPVLNILIAGVLFAPMVGTQVLVSQRYGDGDDRQARSVAFNGLVFAAVIGLAGGLLGYLGAEPFVESFVAISPGVAEGDVLELAIRYLQVVSLGCSSVP